MHWTSPTYSGLMRLRALIVAVAAVCSVGCQSHWRAGHNPLPPRPADLHEAEAEEDDEEAREALVREEHRKFALTEAQLRRALAQSETFRAGLNRLDSTEFSKADAPPVWTSIGPDGLILRYPNQDSHDDNNRYAGFTGGVAVSPANPQLILVSAIGGLWRSVDGGKSFANVTANLEYRLCNRIAFAPGNPETVYAGCATESAGGHALNSFGGFIRSSNAGATWTKPSTKQDDGLPEGLPRGEVRSIVVDPRQPTHLYVGQTNADGLFESTNGGDTFTRIFSGGIHDLELHPTNPSILYIATGYVPQGGPNFPSNAVYRSTDAGRTFTKVVDTPFTAHFVTRLAVSPAAPDVLYALMAGRSANPERGTRIKLTFRPGGGALDRDDRASLAANAFENYFQIDWDPFYEVDPAEPAVQYFGSYSVYKSTDEGSTWQDIRVSAANRVHVDQHSLAWLGGGRSFIVANDGGVWKTNDRGATFQHVNTGFQAADFVGFGIRPSDPSYSCGGLFHNGMGIRSFDGWQILSGGDGGACLFSATTPQVLLKLWGSSYFLTYDLNGAFLHFDPTFGGDSPDKRIAGQAPLVNDGVHSRIYFGTHRVWYSDDFARTWRTTPSNGLDLTRGGNDKLLSIGVARSNDRVLYAGSEAGMLHVSLDGGATWDDRTAALNVGASPIWSINVDPQNAGTAVVGVGGSNNAHVLRTTDAGQTWAVLTGAGASNYGSALPDAPVYAVLIDPLDRNTIYAASEVGIYRYVLGSSNWSAFGRGIPRAAPSGNQSLAAQPADQGGVIQFGSRGAGAYQLQRARPCVVTPLERPRWTGSVGGTDCVSPIQPSFGRAKRFSFWAAVAGRFEIDATSRDFDTYMYVLAADPNTQTGTVIAENDDASGTNVNSHLSVDLAPGYYIIEVSSNTGPFAAGGGDAAGELILSLGGFALSPLTFDAAYYMGRYDDLCAAYRGSVPGATQHFLTFGGNEKRQSSPVFNVGYYLQRYPDVAQAFNNDWQGALFHWLTFGINEGRRASAEFDVVWYLQNNPDVAQLTGGNRMLAIYHWLDYGIAEKRPGSPDVNYPANPVRGCGQPGLPTWRVEKTHQGDFRKGGSGVYSIVVTNTGTSASVGKVEVADDLPGALTATAISGAGWTCVLGALTCTREDSLGPGQRFSTITLTVSVSQTTALPRVTNAVRVSGGGGAGAAGNDLTNLVQ